MLEMSGGTAGSYKCPMCHFKSPTMARNLSHLRLLHSSDPRFSVQCGIGGCAYTGRSFSALYSHIYRRHPEDGIIQKREHQLSIPQEVESALVSGAHPAAASQDLPGIDCKLLYYDYLFMLSSGLHL